jgi:hypothetical protein
MAASGGFAATATYFEGRANRARAPERKSRLLDVAEFYRSLARIVPNMPPGYKTSGAMPALSRAERWKAHAEECRTLADHFHDRNCRQHLASLAEDYDRLAATADR